ncbi:hypothetical protein JTE90_000246 [Oedothorax gibbosus]|uniref:Uncharacterized protein n=1 Tax=Oedothorax gibbosus TaxID=931172 RepID=A0AAV6VV80_9ARAC|nr:hypothetical protein JTE90_000246 [Oedothorax gibbosus]
MIILLSFYYGPIPFRMTCIQDHLEDLPIDEKINQDVKFGPPLELESSDLQQMNMISTLSCHLIMDRFYFG